MRAQAENYRFEERVGSARQIRYETDFPPAGADYEDWRESHNDYLAAAITVTLPETFLPLNAKAALKPDALSALKDDTLLIRIESLDHLLTTSIVDSLADLEHVLAIYRGERNDDRMSPRTPRLCWRRRARTSIAIPARSGRVSPPSPPRLRRT